MSPRKDDHPAVIELNGILSIIDTFKRKGKAPDVQTLNSLRELAVSAMDILLKPDPRTERLSLVVLMLREATYLDEKEIRGKTVVKIYIRDQLGYNWAMQQIHEIAKLLRKIK